MSKLLKSKILLGVMIFAVMFVGFAVVKTASAETCDLGTVTLKQGMSGTAVTCLQTKLSVTPMTGYFGSITKGKVIAFQTANSLVADGVVGALTKAALGTVEGGTLPAGCTSSTGFSTTTGLSCALTGLPAGCTSTTGYSPTTGASCASGISQGPLTGGAGDVDSIDLVTTSVKSEVLESANDTKVLGFDVKADNGSDLAISSLRLEFENQGGAVSNHLNRYIDEVSVWSGSTKVGSADVADFSESNDIYSKSITLTNVVVKAGEELRLYVAVSAVSSIDTLDQVPLDWGAELLSVRTLDASGAIITFTTAALVGAGQADVAELFGFSDLAGSGDLNFKISKATTSPVAQAVEADDASETDVDMLEFKLKAEGSDLVVDDLSIDLTAVGNNLDDMISEIKLMKGSDELDSVTPANFLLAGAGLTDVVFFADLADDITIDDGDTVTLKVVATINAIDGAPLINGDSLTASYTAAARAGNEIIIGAGNNDGACDAGEDCYLTDVEDTNGDQVANGDRSGSATGAAQAFYATGLTVSNQTTSAVTTFVADLAGEDDIGKFIVNFKVTAFGNDIYLNSTTQLSDEVAPYVPGTAPGEGIVFDIFSAGAGVHDPTVTSILECVSNCGLAADNPTGMFFIADGDAETYRLTVTFGADAATPLDDNYKVWLSSINWDTDGDTDASPDFFYTSNLGQGTEVDTGYLFLNDM